jgi:hypothetical protein
LLSATASCPGSTTSSGEGQFNVSDTCVHNASSSFTATHAVNIDKTAPAAACGVADGMWHTADVSFSCLPSDALSGLVNPSGFTLTTSVPAQTETSNALTNQNSFQDKAGNTSSAGPIGGNKVDKKPPVILIRQPAAQYTHSQTLNYTVKDGGSGVASVTLTINGNAPVAGNSMGIVAIPLLTSFPLGPNTLLISSADNVGNQSSLPVTFTIIVTPPSMIDEVNQLQPVVR